MERPIEIKYWLENPKSEEAINECKNVVRILEKTSCLLVRDPRTVENDNQRFLDTMEQYFQQPLEDIMADVHPELNFQVGITPSGAESPLCVADPKCHEIIAELSRNAKNAPLQPSRNDVKWRFLHRIGPRPTKTKFNELNCQPVCPAAIPNFTKLMDSWGNQLLAAAKTITEMIAVGYGLPKDTITNMMKYGPHLLAPTGSDLSKYNKLNTILAGFHRDIDFLTLHGKSRFPGLDIWLRDGTKFLVSVPDGCLLVQAGMQLEYLTGGRITAGWHQVTVNEQTLTAIQTAKKAGRPLWRISSTLFCHIESDVEMRSLIGTEQEKKKEAEKLPPIIAGEFIKRELYKINLFAQDSKQGVK
ncbi:uncharacterized protein LOC105698171 [Orussus abietinus]|uniref:uncharacterized protein LOC105698171 n=1 Tax=Orussus abietinus TaxID=222816 RepID=UPI000625F441|nr:uncharacterized protein LOC105698171 [Orussus abietinus]